MSLGISANCWKKSEHLCKDGTQYSLAVGQGETLVWQALKTNHNTNSVYTWTSVFCLFLLCFVLFCFVFCFVLFCCVLFVFLLFVCLFLIVCMFVSLFVCLFGCLFVFFTFSAVYASVRPHRVQEMLKYAQVVRTAAARHKGWGWRSYDIQFRLR